MTNRYHDAHAPHPPTHRVLAPEERRAAEEQFFTDAREAKRAKFKAILDEDAGLIAQVAMALCQTNRVYRSMPSEGEVLDKVPEALYLIKLVRAAK